MDLDSDSEGDEEKQQSVTRKEAGVKRFEEKGRCQAEVSSPKIVIPETPHGKTSQMVKSVSTSQDFDADFVDEDFFSSSVCSNGEKLYQEK